MSKQSIKLTVDAVVFGYEEGNISILLIKRKYSPFKGKYGNPGGFVINEESLEEMVQRELQEEAAIKINYLEQLYTFVETNIEPRARVMIVKYFRMVRPNAFKIIVAIDATQVQWFNFNKRPELFFNHKTI
jgi:8-oxo-dGTP diphosphatase